ncbi:hypothetical protein Syun_001555 [Stephania yunnanensis]|uniref:Uncharacterized protein n=1 Tax=Stephania yunnanensis TaxID=152371 RepID=A0AAP0LEZ0_9MAGN
MAQSSPTGSGSAGPWVRGSCLGMVAQGMLEGLPCFYAHVAPRRGHTSPNSMHCPYQGATLLMPKESAEVLPCSCPRRALAHAKRICQGATLLMPKDPAKARPSSYQGVTLLVPKESTKTRGLARAKGICQGATLLVPKNLLRHDLARAKVQPCSCQENLPRLASCGWADATAATENTRPYDILRQAPFLVPFTSRVKIFTSVALSVGGSFFDRVGVSAIDCPYPCDNTCHNLVSKGLGHDQGSYPIARNHLDLVHPCLKVTWSMFRFGTWTARWCLVKPRYALPVPRRGLARAIGICQGVALLVPKELAKARPCSCQRNLLRRGLARAKGIC